MTAVVRAFKSSELAIPADFEEALKKNEAAWRNFQGYAPSHKRQHLLWIASAKRAETRKRRIEEAVRMIASKNA